MQPAAARALTATTRRLTMTPIEAQRSDGHRSGGARLSTGGAAKSPSHARIEGMRYRVLAPVALIVVFVAGCTSGSGGGDPTRTPSVTPPVTSSTTPVESSSTPTHSTPPTKVPEPRDQARQHTSRGAVAFAEFWFRELNWAYSHVSAALIRRYSSRSCSDCELLAQSIDRVRAMGLRYSGGHVVVEKADKAPNDGRHGAEAAVDVTVSQRVLLVHRGNEIVHRGAASTGITFRLWLAWRRGGWTVVQKGHVI